jgi:hypothetical protein
MSQSLTFLVLWLEWLDLAPAVDQQLECLLRGFVKCKDKVFPNLSCRLKKGMECWASTLTLAFGRNGPADRQLHAPPSHYCQGNPFAVIYVRGWMDHRVTEYGQKQWSFVNFPSTLNELRHRSPPWILILVLYYNDHYWSVSLQYLLFYHLWHFVLCATEIAIGTCVQWVAINRATRINTWKPNYDKSVSC